LSVSKKNIVTIVITLNGILVAVFGAGIFATMDRLRDIYHSPERIEANEKQITHLQKAKQLTFQWARNMNDDIDQNDYYIDGHDGTNDHIHRVDIRTNNEGYQTGFIYDLWDMYPIRIDPADSLLEIDFFNPETGREDYIPLKRQPR